MAELNSLLFSSIAESAAALRGGGTQAGHLKELAHTF